MKILVIGGNRFVGLRVTSALDKRKDIELHVFNRTGLVRHVHNAVLHKGNHESLEGSTLDRDWDVVIDFAAFTAMDAEESITFFRNVGRYIFISTASVYDPGILRTESAFDPLAWEIRESPDETEKANLYKFGKRQAEAVFAQRAKFPVTMIRFPFILGPDDYTHRLSFHYDRVRDGKSIYMPAPKVKISVVQSEDAADFLLWSIDQKFTGPVNVASPEVLGLDELLKWIAESTGRKPLLVNQETDSNHSPYGVHEDSVLDVSRLISLGFKPKSLHAWLPGLIGSMADPASRQSKLH